MILYTWGLYPLLLKLLATIRRPTPPPDFGPWPSASVVLAVHNEEALIDGALADLLALDYPLDRIEFLVVSDGSTDATEDKVRAHAAADARIRLLPRPRGGVTEALAEGVAAARNEVIVRTDAETRHRCDYLRRLLRHYRDPGVGGVGGAFTFANLGETGITRNEGLYWKFEMFLRKVESDLGLLSTASSAALSFRRELFERFSPVYSEDVVIPKLIVKRGYRMVQEPQAVAYEVMPPDIRVEYGRRKRMVVRGITGILSPEGAFSPIEHPGHWWSIVSHKLLRWFTPFGMAGSFLSSITLARQRLYGLAALGHALFYACAAAGYALERRGCHIRVFSAAFSFCLANVAFAVGLIEALRGRRISAFKTHAGRQPG